MCHCISCEWDCPLKHLVYVSLCQLWVRLTFKQLHVTVSAVYVSLCQLWVRLTFKQLHVTVSAVYMSLSAVSETDLQAATCHCVSCVCVTVSREWDRPSSSCVTVSVVGETAPLSTPLYVSLCQLCMCHCDSCEGDCPFKHSVYVTVSAVCHCVRCEGDCPFKHPVYVTVSAVYVSTVSETGLQAPLCMCHCVCVTVSPLSETGLQAPCVCHFVSCVSLCQMWGKLSLQAPCVCHCVSCVCVTVSAVSETGLQAPCVCVTCVCVTVSAVSEAVPSSTPLRVSLCQLCMWHCQLWGRLSLQALCVCVTVSAVYVSLCQLWGRLSLQTPLCMRHYVSCVCVIVLTVFIYEWLFTWMFICCCWCFMIGANVWWVYLAPQYSSCNCTDTWQ